MNRDIVKNAVIDSFKKLNPKVMVKNPIMFIFELGTALTLLVSFFLSLFKSTQSFGYNLTITIVLFVILLFANFAEAIAEGRGKAQTDTLKKTKKDTQAKLIERNGNIKVINSSELRKGDIVEVLEGEIIPSDGEIIEGIASVDESAITGESAPVIKEAGGDFSSVTGGTRVISNSLKIKITVSAGESFLNKMINL